MFAIRSNVMASAKKSIMASRAMTRGMASKTDEGAVKFEIQNPFKLHNLEEGPKTEVYATREELMEYYELMYTMRRMEITCDNEYKAQNIRGFCHLYDGQEAVATGIEAAFDKEDSWITSYRCHAIMLARGGSVKNILAELFGRGAGHTGGKGGSMHFYNKEQNFYGGQGIVGAQVPVGAGLSFANKYKHEGAGAEGLMPIGISMYGDGAANQGQIWEAANMAALWKLPHVFFIENNQYGMGTSKERSSSNNTYYTMGNHIPGIWVDGMDVLAMREAGRFMKEWCGSGKGPLYVEASTYRYHGHSMSDPGVTYRNREEISETRAQRDPIESVKKRLIDSGLADADELKVIEKRIRKEVVAATKEAKAEPLPPIDSTYKDIYTDGTPHGNEYPPFLRLPDNAKSLYYGKPRQ